ncbi:hypothetical protein F4819DRAFT_194774 [Hypoxylon fuscum]|nr:hypothetical protein F4819DRAFT_194774 [Hypoxylon fuscum]
MADLPPPSPPKRKLPFKRTVRRKSSEVVDEDGLSLFSRSGEFFEEQQRLAKEKAEKEKAAKAEKERKEQLARDRKTKEDALKKQVAHDQESKRKRRRISLSDDETKNDSDDDDIFGYKSTKKQKSPSMPHTPSSKRESSFITSTKGSGGRLTRSSSRKAGAPLITLDDDDDNNPFAPQSPSKLSPTKRPRLRDSLELQSPPKSSSGISKHDAIALDDDSDAQADTGEARKDDEEEDPSEYYVRAAMERARKAKEEREAREKEGGEVEDDPVIQILVHSRLDGIHVLMFRRKLSQQLTVVYKTWVEQQVAKHSLIPRSTLETMFFTWKGNKVYQHTTLKTLGIKPERDGKLYPTWKTEREGYHGRDKVLFEAWTQELYDDYLKEKEKQRLRDLGELLDDEPNQETEQPQDSQNDQKIRVQFKAKSLPVKNATVRSSTTAAQLVKVYRRLAEIPEDKTIELRWDGEVLDPDTTVEEAEIEDMDSLEVHIK